MLVSFTSIGGRVKLGAPSAKTDGLGVATVTVAVHALPIRLLPNGQVRAAALGTPGGTYQFQRSADLSAWQPLGAPVMADAAGNVIIIDPAPLPAKAFYRAFPNS
jgi:hypothetical protein